MTENITRVFYNKKYIDLLSVENEVKEIMVFDNVNLLLNTLKYKIWVFSSLEENVFDNDIFIIKCSCLLEIYNIIIKNIVIVKRNTNLFHSIMFNIRKNMISSRLNKEESLQWFLRFLVIQKLLDNEKIYCNYHIDNEICCQFRKNNNLCEEHHNMIIDAKNCVGDLFYSDISKIICDYL